MALSQNDLISLIAGNIPTNGAAEVTAANVRNVLEQISDSALNTVDGDSRIESYSVSNNSGLIAQTLIAGATLNLCSTILEANEAAIGQNPVFLNVIGATQATYLDETNDKLLFPSNANTYSVIYAPYSIRVILKFDHGAVSTNQTIELFLTLRRVIDDSVVSQKTHIIHNHAAVTGQPVTLDFNTFVNTEADPYVVDGMYVQVENNASSSASIDITEFDLRIFKS